MTKDNCPDGSALSEELCSALVAHNRRSKMDEAVEAALMQAGAQINALQANERRLIDELWKAQQQRDELRRALEIIAVGDAQNPQAQAAEELIALGWWRDIPEALTMAAAPAVGCCITPG